MAGKNLKYAAAIELEIRLAQITFNTPLQLNGVRTTGRFKSAVVNGLRPVTESGRLSRF